MSQVSQQLVEDTGATGLLDQEELIELKVESAGD